MGKSDTIGASLGMKILLSDLVSQITETNFHTIKKLLANGMIEDENDELNGEYSFVIDDVDMKLDWSVVKPELTKKFTKGKIYNKYVLIPIKDILSTTRWGYSREGTNCLSKPIDFNLDVNVEQYQDIQNYQLVFILTQNSG